MALESEKQLQLAEDLPDEAMAMKAPKPTGFTGVLAIPGESGFTGVLPGTYPSPCTYPYPCSPPLRPCPCHMCRDGSTFLLTV